MRILVYWISAIGVLFPLLMQAQSSGAAASLIGLVTDNDGTPLPGVTVFLEGTEINTATNLDGEYRLEMPANRTFTVVYSFVGFKQVRRPNLRLRSDEFIRYDVQLESSNALDEEIVVIPFEKREIDALHVEREDLERIPTTDGNLTSLIKYLAPGVTAGTGGELTSQYSVRGGNYDENLIYVNDFEIYRPLLVRSGQQEGLIFPNTDMLDYLSFSSGGFKAQYGDKMSSVLDIHYRRPYELEASVGGSLLGGSLYLGGAVYKDSVSQARKVPNRFTYAIGARYKTTSYLLSSLNVKGEYIPQFVDLQGDFIYDLNEKWQVEVIGHYSNSIYSLTPVESEETKGLFNKAIRLTTLFEGREVSNFENFTVGTSVTYLPWGGGRDKAIDTTATVSNNLRFKLMGSHYQSYENERIDIINFYRLEEVETGLGEDNFDEVIGTLAYGETHLFARNYLQAEVTHLQWRGTYLHDRYNSTGTQDHHWLKWGIGYKREIIRDKLKEWRRLDSLGFTLPHSTARLGIPEYVRTNVSLNSHRLDAFVQNTWEHQSLRHLFRLTGGVRASYWSLNNEFLVAPRVQLYYTPLKFRNLDSDTTKPTKDLTFKVAGGLYYQPPFYRELRDLKGNVNQNVLAQKSAHVLAGVVWDFVAWKRKFKFIAEAYYKHQWDLVPYDIDNVRIRYYGDNLATGYVAGVDFRLNGELVDNLESWVNLSFLRAREAFNGVQHGVRRFQNGSVETINTPDAPKATDQLMIFSTYFQDDFPKAPWARVNLAFTVGTGLPFGIPGDNVEFRNTYRFSAYHRIDLGASFSIWDRKLYLKKNKPALVNGKHNIKHPLKFFKGIWISVEIFNLMDVANEASNTWIKDFTNRSYAISSTLTSRRINVRFKVDF